MLNERGADFEYDDRFMIIDQMISDHDSDSDAPLKKGQEPFDWSKIDRECEALAAETNDLRIAVWWLRARLESFGLPGWVHGLEYIQALIEKPVDAVHPCGDDEATSGELHATTLSWLCSPRGSAAFRKLRIFDSETWTFSDLMPDPLGGRQQSEEDLSKLRESLLTHPGARETHSLLLRAQASAEAIFKQLDIRAGDASGDFSEMISMLGHAAKRFAELALPSAIAAEPIPNVVENSIPSSGGNSAQVSSGRVLAGLQIHSRDEVRITLEALLRYYLEHESGHPAPLFIQRLQRMVDMSFELLMRELFTESESLLGRLAKPASN